MGPLPDGSYRVQFSDPNNVLATQLWQSAVTVNAATPVNFSVSDGNEHGGVNATRTAAATITGLVTDEAGAPLADVCVNANTPEYGGFSGLGSSTRTAADGTYSLTGVPGGIDVRVQFHDCSLVQTHVDQWYNGVTDANASTSLVLAPGELRAGIDARLPDGIRVGGTVTDSAGNPLANIDVNINPDGPGASGFARTDSTGHYATTPVPPGRYRVQFRDDSSPPAWAATYWQQQPSYNSATLLEPTSLEESRGFRPRPSCKRPRRGWRSGRAGPGRFRSSWPRDSVSGAWSVAMSSVADICSGRRHRR
jgi:protocatechuate 3,4-dioxygenase beta subunit